MANPRRKGYQFTDWNRPKPQPKPVDPEALGWEPDPEQEGRWTLAGCIEVDNHPLTLTGRNGQIQYVNWTGLQFEARRGVTV